MELKEFRMLFWSNFWTIILWFLVLAGKLLKRLRGEWKKM